jgi:negative regulator of genetic competence, sporulation and motility
MLYNVIKEAKMELIIINENKLKITMTAPDMKKYGIDENEFHLSLTDTKKILKRILSSSPVETGFENIGTGEKLLLQLYPEKHGGCELYITRISLCSDEKEEIELSEDDSELYLLPQSTKITTMAERRPTAYFFEDLESLILACKELQKYGFSEKSSLFAQSYGKYYLIISERITVAEKEKSRQYSFLSEFGERIIDKSIHVFLTEHGKAVIYEDAVSKLSQI